MVLTVSSVKSFTTEGTQSELTCGNKRILELARCQRMNTDVRKQIFVVIMTCEVSYDICIFVIRLTKIQVSD